MAAAWTQKQREIYDLLTKGMSFSQVVEQGYAKATVSKVKKAIDNGEIPPEPKAAVPTIPKVVTAGTIQSPGFITPGNRPPVLFDLGQQTIPLAWQSLYEAHRYYQDFVDEEGIEDGFGEMLLWCVKDVWKRFRTRTRIESGKIIMEVDNGENHGRSGEGEGGSQSE